MLSGLVRQVQLEKKWSRVGLDRERYSRRQETWVLSHGHGKQMGAGLYCCLKKLAESLNLIF